MDRKLVIRIKKPTQAEFLLGVILVLPFLFGVLIELFRLPNALKYLCDLAWLCLLLLMLLQRGTKTREQKILIGVAGCFFLYTLVGSFINFGSPLYYLWGVRNNFRMYIAFFAFVFFGKQTGRESFLKFLDGVFWLNAAICLIQYFLMGKQRDNLGGIFGVSYGCNSFLNNYFVLIAIKELIQYLNGEGKLWNCVCKCGTMLVLSAFAELKFFYVEFVLILVMSTLLTEFTWKKVLIIAGGLVGVVLATQMLVRLFPIFEGIFSIRAMLESASSDKGYTNKGDINRLNAISVISDRFLDTWSERMVGRGLGNCDTSTFAFLNTPFYKKYSFLNYSWFSLAFIFLEMGYIGLAFFFGFFVLVFLLAARIAKRLPQNRSYCLMTMICAVCCVVIGIYNSSLRNEAGYMMYFMLALPFLKGTTWDDTEEEKKAGS